MADAQHPPGAFPDVAPRLTLRRAGAPAWGDAGVIVPWTMWKMYGDTAVLDRHFGAMTAVDGLPRARPTPTTCGPGSWATATTTGSRPGDDDTPPELLATAYWAHDAALMAEIADATGRADEAAGYRALGPRSRSAFTDAFVAADGRVASRDPDRLRARPCT